MLEEERRELRLKSKLKKQEAWENMYTCLQDGRLVERTNELDLEDVTIMKEVEMADVFE